jgi:hypothetical protein
VSKKLIGYVVFAGRLPMIEYKDGFLYTFGTGAMLYPKRGAAEKAIRRTLRNHVENGVKPESVARLTADIHIERVYQEVEE